MIHRPVGLQRTRTALVEQNLHVHTCLYNVHVHCVCVSIAYIQQTVACSEPQLPRLRTAPRPRCPPVTHCTSHIQCVSPVSWLSFTCLASCMYTYNYVHVHVHVHVGVPLTRLLARLRVCRSGKGAMQVGSLETDAGVSAPLRAGSVSSFTFSSTSSVASSPLAPSYFLLSGLSLSWTSCSWATDELFSVFELACVEIHESE